MMKEVNKVEHVVKGWEKKYGYLGVTIHEREFFAPLLNKSFSLNLLGKVLSNRTYSIRYKRIYVGREAMRELEIGDILICYKDMSGNYIIEKKLNK